MTAENFGFLGDSDSDRQLPLLVKGTAPSSCRPFVKWVGGKGAIVDQLIELLPHEYNRYFEPFVGGGAMFFAIRPKHAYLSDVNPELIASYKAVKNHVDELIEDLKTHVYDKEYYYAIRDADRSTDFENWSEIQRASRFIYLNKTCYNGLCRVNSRGEFNTPMGRYKDPTIVDEKNLRACNKALRRARIARSPFSRVERLAETGDFVYFDPPYVPLNPTSNFTAFSRQGFNQHMQQELRDLCVRLDKRGVMFMLSNSAAPVVRELYRGFRIREILVARPVNSRAGKRGKIAELVVTNY